MVLPQNLFLEIIIQIETILYLFSKHGTRVYYRMVREHKL